MDFTVYRIKNRNIELISIIVTRQIQLLRKFVHE